MDIHSEKREMLQQPGQQSLYDTAVQYGRFLTSRVTSATSTIRSTGTAASGLPTRSSSPGRTGAGYITNPAMETNNGSKGRRGAHSPTAYLQGVRGIAAVIVYIYHCTWAFSGVVEEGYGVSEHNLFLIQLPFLRLVHAGHAMVALFFLIGGYVNAARPLQLIRQQRHAELTTAVGASLLRRGVRLYLPPMAATLATAFAAYLGVFEPARRNIDTLQNVFFWPDFHPGRKDTLWAAVADWREQMGLLLNPWTPPIWTHYDPHLWTVTLEFRASLVVTVCLAALACCRVGARLCIMALMIYAAVRCNKWEVALFLAGAVLAELDIIRNEHTKASSLSPGSGIHRGGGADYDFEAELGGRRPQSQEPRGRPTRTLGIVALALAGLYLLSYPPRYGDETPGYITIYNWLVPSWTDDPKRYVHAVGGVLFLIALSSNKTMQRPFLTPTAQYLGNISYSLYIVHGPLLHAIGYVTGPALLAFTGVETSADRAKGILLTLVFNFGIVLAVADVFYRFVDVGSVRVATAFQRLCTIRPE